MIDKFKEMFPKTTEVLQCKVLTESPLLLQVVDQPKRQIPEDFLILTRNVQDYTVKADINIRNGNFKLMDSSETKVIDILQSSDFDLTIKNALKVGEIVLVLGFDESQNFMVVDRVV